MPTNNLEDFKQEMRNLQISLEKPLPTDGEGAIECLQESAVFMARTGHLVAIMENIYNKARNQEGVELLGKLAKQTGMSAKIQNQIMDGVASEEKYYLTWSERLNRGFTHKIDACRSILSWEKENLKAASLT